jgi:hypothetical protein
MAGAGSAASGEKLAAAWRKNGVMASAESMSASIIMAMAAAESVTLAMQ